MKFCEASVQAREVAPGQTVLRWTTDCACVVSGFYARLANCIGPKQEPVIVGLRVGDTLRPERVQIPVYGAPLNAYTKTGGLAFPPLDVAQEYHVALAEPVTFVAGEPISLEIISTGTVAGGIVAGLQFQGIWPLAEMRSPFRESKTAGPVCRMDWSKREVICTGTQKRFDPRCAPQNNSGVVADADGTLFQFTTFYSVDEQYDNEPGVNNTHAGAFARTFGFRKRPGADQWEDAGLLFEFPPGITYLGDPFAFRDLDGIPCLALSAADGSKERGFADCAFVWAYLVRSKTRSFAGPWNAPHALWERFPLGPGKAERAACLRIYPRTKTNDYFICWMHGMADISFRGAIVANLDTTLTHEQVEKAPILVRNQDEGGGGFLIGDKGYLSTWQVPNVNDVTGIQRLYEIDLNDPLNPEAWQALPGSWGFNYGTNPVEDGGASADSWSLSLVGAELWATYVAWSVTHRKNSLLACHVPWERGCGDVFRFGMTRVPGYGEVAPVIEYGLGEQCELSVEIMVEGPESWPMLLLAPASRPLHHGGIAVEVTPNGSRMAAWYDQSGQYIAWSRFWGAPLQAGRFYRLRLQRDGLRMTGWVDDMKLASIVLDTVYLPEQLRRLAEPQRFKLYGRQGGLYTVRNAVLIDGPGAGEAHMDVR